MTREIVLEDGTRWEALATDAIVAHGRVGAVLAFRLVGGSEEDLLRSTVTFNSMKAAEFALSTAADKDLRRRLSLARMAVGGV